MAAKKNERGFSKEREKLPEEYLMRMKRVFGEDYEDFLGAYDEPPRKGLRFNTLKARPETISMLVEKWGLKPVPWCPSGWIYEEEAEGHEIRPGKSPYHAAGVFYIQEPSAMITAEKADIGPEDVVLDLCAAPGGKSGQAACKAKFLLSNEIMKDRARILSSNIERLGFRNVIVSSASGEELSEIFPEFFDKIIVDAPCSGEGMMRRDDTARREWSEENVRLCVKRQRDILESALKMLKAGGRIVYSTCTFEPDENDGMAESFCSDHSNLVLSGMTSIYPHKADGEGHFCAEIDRRDGAVPPVEAGRDIDLEEIRSEVSRRLAAGHIHVLRNGVTPGEHISGKHKKEDIYVPSHAEILARTAEELKADSIDLKSETAATAYLRGESIRLSDLGEEEYELRGVKDGSFIAVCYDGYAMGLGKYVGGVIKNHYPKGLRQF